MADWPTSLPALGLVGAQITANSSVLKSSMDSGPPVRRNRFTAVTKSLTYTMILTGAQVATLDTFFHDTLSNGALTFNWIDPRDDSAAIIAFTKPPQYTSIRGGAVADRLWSTGLALEIQP